MPGRHLAVALIAGPLLLAATSLSAEVVHLVQNLNDKSTGSDPRRGAVLGCKLIFSADDGVVGRELWTYRSRFVQDQDGCNRPGSGRPTLLRDIWPGAQSSNAYPVVEMESIVYLVATDGEHGYELWRTDATFEGTFMISDINEGAEGSQPHSFVRLGQDVYFSATDPAHGAELWKTNGTASGTELVADLRPGPDGSNPVQLTVALSSIFLLADDDMGSQELWRVSAKGKATRLLTGVAPAPGWPPPLFVPTSGLVYFSAAVDGEERRLWRTDGTPGGTVPVTTPAGHSLMEPMGLLPYRGQLVLSADDGVSGVEPWVTNGSPEGTKLLMDVRHGSGSSEPAEFFEWKGVVFFAADDGEHGRELWRTDGTRAETWLFRDVNYSPGRGSSPSDFVDLGDKMMFGANGSYDEGMEPWVTDGTPDGTRLLKDIQGGFLASGALRRGSVTVGNRVFFPAFDGYHGLEMWVSDGTREGTFMLRDVAPGSESAWPFYYYPSLSLLVPFEGKLVMSLNDQHHGNELWESDGTMAGTRLIADLRTDVLEGSDPLPILAVGPDVYFSPRRFPGGLWKSDGMRESALRLDPGTERRLSAAIEFKGEVYVARDYKLNAVTGEMSPLRAADGSRIRSAGGFTVLDGVLYFKVTRGSFGTELWRTDGTMSGTSLVKEIVPGIEGGLGTSDPVATTELLFFEADDRIDGSQLWRSDGTGEGTFPLADTAEDAFTPEDFAYPFHLTPVGDTVFFVAGSGTERKIWLSDGSAEGTRPLHGEDLPSPPKRIEELTRVGDSVFFLAAGADFQVGLWKTDGTSGGARLVMRRQDSECPHIYAIPFSSLTEHGGELFFGGRDCASGYQLWKSDGTPDGTAKVLGSPPVLGTWPASLASVGDFLAFSFGTEGLGRELWLTDGTSEGTRMVADIHPGEGDSDPADFLLADRQIFFTADDGHHGRELWVLELPGLWTSLEVGLSPADAGRVDSSPPGIACGGVCRAEFLFDRIVEMDARPGDGWILDHWSGSPDCVDGVVGMVNDMSCEAHFSACNVEEHRTLASMTVFGYQRQATCGSIVAGPALEITPMGTLSLVGGVSVALVNGVTVVAGGELSISNHE